MHESKTEQLITLLIVVLVIFLITNLGLFLRINRLQIEVIQALRPFQLPNGLQAGSRAPSFSLIDTDERLISLDDLKGDRTLLAFISPSCPSCIAMYPELLAFTDQHPDVRIVAISNGSPSENFAVAKDVGFKFLILTADDAVFSSYEIPGTPWFFMLDERGMITNQGSAVSSAQLDRLLIEGG